jgi:hypothetical protein
MATLHIVNTVLTQSFIEMLDSEFHNKARDTYIETILDLPMPDNLLT